MMSKILKNIKSKRNLLLLLVLVTSFSCNNFLEQTPPDGLVRSEYWTNKEEVLATLAGAYKKFAVLDEYLFIHGEVRGDMIDPGSSLQWAQRQMMEVNILSDNRWAQWDKLYVVINLCNHVLKLAPGVQKLDATFSDYLLQQYLSEAIFLRSLSYFYLVRIYKDAPYITDPSETDEVDFFPALTDGDEILDAIEADLNSIRLKIPNNYPTIEESKSRATTGAVNALLADIALWRFKYEDCIKYANAVEESGLYFLLPGDEWFELFQPGFSLEGIFEIYYDKASGQENTLYNRTATLNYYVGSKYALDILSTEVFEAAEIIRGYGSLDYRDKIWKYAGQVPDQRSARSSSDNTSANFIIYRLADVMLMKAEALSQLGRYDEALEIINTIRLRANVLPIDLPNDPTSFEDAILEERAKEFAYEGKRWFDLLRMARRNDYARKDKLIEILIQDVPSTQKLVKAARLTDPMGWYMPIYQNEIEANRNLEQNPYYYED